MITDALRRNHLARLVEAWDDIFDPEVVGLRHPGIKSAHQRSSGREESLHYALALLEMAERSRQGRAEAIINQSIDASAPPGPMALTLSLIWHRHRRRLPSSLGEKIAVDLCALANRIHSTDTDHQNIPSSTVINEIFVLLSAARILDNQPLQTHAIRRLIALGTHSPRLVNVARDAVARDLAVTLAGFRAIDSYIPGADAPALLETALTQFQNEGLPVLQIRSGKTSGTELLTFLVANALRGIQSGSPDSGQRTFAALYACVMKIESTPARLSDEASLPAH